MFAPDLIDLIQREYTPGTAPPIFDVNGVGVGLAICFDVIYDEVIWAGARDGAQVYMFQTNNADFRGTDENLQQLAFARMRAIETGRSVVNLSSVSGLSASPNIGLYGISKAAIINLTVQLAEELAPRVRVNAVAPAVVKTAFARALYEGREAEASAPYPLGRLGEVDDVAGPVAFLLSDDAAWITGQTVVIDGGASIRSAL
jgi:NAD(P)-dependent dehydrogenase (short-subunit alcohol dehydrogenase family)